MFDGEKLFFKVKQSGLGFEKLSRAIEAKTGKILSFATIRYHVTKKNVDPQSSTVRAYEMFFNTPAGYFFK